MSNFPAPSPTYIGPANRHGAANNDPINHITIHCTVSACCKGARSIANYFKTTSNAASAHYVVDATEAIQSLYDSYVAYHAPPNQHSLGIEMCCSLSGQGKGHWARSDHKKMLDRTALLTAQLCLAYDVPPVKLSAADLRAGKKGICGHVDVSDAFHQTTHWDPGPYFPWADFMGLVRKHYDALKAPAKPARPIKPAAPKPVRRPNAEAIAAAAALGVKGNPTDPAARAVFQKIRDLIKPYDTRK